jgi:DNA-directed RNA polymerase subunit beta'
MIDKIKDLGFVAGTVSGLSVSITDCQIYPEKDKIINQANQQAAGIEQNYKQGLITSQELKRLSQELWLETTEELADHTWKYFRPSNPIKLIIDAKVGRASRDQVKQLSAMKGLVVDPLGNIVELPTKSNYRQGLSIFEYVTSARGSRKGLTDSALKTADAGYLTRRLVDVAHEVIIREQDCGTPNGITITTSAPRSKVFAKRLLGRTLAQPIKPGKKTLYPAGEVLSEEHIDQILKNKITEVQVRSPLTCQAHHGLCATCYGWDYATKQPTVIGNPVGILAAQSIGEPGTQLTMRVKHAGGVVKSDVTQGLPRVEELFEARIPKLTVPLADFDGKISISKQADGHLVTLKPSDKKGLSPKEYLIPLTLKLNVEPKQLVSAGTPLAQGPLDIHQILRIKGLREAQLYLLHEIQAVYESQGIPIHDKHFEVIIRQMSQKVKIIDPGTTSFTAGELVNHDQLEEQIEKIKSQKDKPTSQIIILGISKASLQTESWLSAASFEQTTNVIARSALEGKVDHLLGLKENVIIGRLIPTSPERAMLSAE